MPKKQADPSGVRDPAKDPRARRPRSPSEPEAAPPEMPARTNKEAADRTRMTVTGKLEPNPHRLRKR